jgi:hypothetical protein
LEKTREHDLIRIGNWKRGPVALNLSVTFVQLSQFKSSNIYGHLMCAGSKGGDAENTEIGKMRLLLSIDS